MCAESAGRSSSDIKHSGSVQGASTIEQQFIKNALQAQSHRTIFEKLREAALAYQLSHKWSKEKIITAYLNTIYFGNGAYGIEAAAETYFGHEINHQGCGTPGQKLCVQELTPWEAALLAGIIRSPTEYNPVYFPQAAKERRDLVLSQMLQQGYITRPVYDESVRQALPAPKSIQAPQEQTVEGVDAGYFTSWAAQQVVERYGAPRAFDGGLRIRTTLDLQLQHAAEQAISGYLANPEGPTASLVAIENSTGEVRAMVGGRSYSETPFNLATEGERQPGSAFKAFDLAAALKDGVSPYSVWTSKEKTFYVHGQHGVEKFEVHNDEGSYSGSNTLTGATAASDNSIFAEVGLKVGTRRIALLAHRMGITTPLSTNPAMTIGGLTVGVTPIDMAHAYETIAHGGRRVTGSMAEGGSPVGIQEVEAGGQQAPRRLQARRQQSRDRADPADVRRRNRDIDARDRRSIRHREGRRDRPVRGGKDRHDRELRRRLVRRLEQQVHGRRLGRLPEQARADDHRLQRRPRVRRHLPRADLAQLHPLRTAGGQRTRRKRRFPRHWHGHLDGHRRSHTGSGRADVGSDGRQDGRPHAGSVHRRNGRGLPHFGCGRDAEPRKSRGADITRTGAGSAVVRGAERTRAGGADVAVSDGRGQSRRLVRPDRRARPGHVAVARRTEPPRELHGLGDPDARSRNDLRGSPLLRAANR